MTIHFKEVGRDKKSWSKQFPKEATESQIAREAKRGGSLMSSCVEAEIWEQGDGGAIYAGFRRVGSFTISHE